MSVLCSMVGGTFSVAAAGNTVSFDGTSSYYSATGISSTAADQFLGIVAISFYWNGGDDGQHLFSARLGTGSSDLGFYFDIQSSRIRFVGVYGNGTAFGQTTFNQTLKSNDWNHFTALINSAYIPGSYGFLNGVATGLASSSGGTPYDTVRFNYANTATTITIGDKNASQTASGVKFNGKIRHLAFWSNITGDGYYEPTRFWNPANDRFRDLGTTGTSSGLPAPIIYHYGDTTTFATNNGANFGSYTLTANGVSNGDTLSLTTSRHPRVFKTHGTNAVISTTQSKFGGSSLFVSNSPGGNSVTGSAIKNQEPMDFMPGSMKNPAGFHGYTLEAFVRYSSFPFGTTTGEGASGPFNVSKGGDGFVKWTFGANGQGKITFTYPAGGLYGGTTVQESTASLSLNTWHHIALVIDTTTVSLYVDGSRKVTTTINDQSPYNVGEFYIGSIYSGYAVYVDEVRQSSIARYSGTTFTVPTSEFTHDANTTLLMHYNDLNSSTNFVDDNGQGRLSKVITAVGDAKISTAQYKYGSSSAVFDGTGDYLNLTASDFNFESEFTVEGWIRPTADAQTFFCTAQSGTSTGFWISTWTGASAIVGYRTTVGGGAGAAASSAGVLTYNAWNHIALSRSGTTAELYVNGTRVLNITDFYNSNTSTLEIGRGRGISDGAWGSSPPFAYTGHIDEVRVSNIRRYSGATSFTPSPTAFVSDGNTLLLMHMEGYNTSTIFYDDNLSARASKSLVANGNAQLDTAQYKFGSSSMLFDGTGDYFASTFASDESFGTGNFTVEFWYRPAAIGAIQVPIGNRSGGPGLNIWWVEIGSDGTAYAAFQNSAGTSFYPASPSTYAANTWYHIAIVRNGSTLTFYRNGTGGTAVTGVTGSFGGGVNYYIGGIVGSYNVNGWLDEVRISKVARYTANFTAPTAPFVNDASTLLLIHAEGADASTVIIDDISLPT